MARFRCEFDRDSPAVAYLQAYFVTIATILGTGILGLPVTLTESGLYPFLISFLIDACMQSVLIHFFTDLLQRAYAVQLENQKEEAVPLNKLVEEEINIDYEDTGDALMKEVQLPDIEGRTLQPPNLHLLGKLFLGCGFQQAFDVLIILQFIALLICYALAGSEAYAEVIGIDHFYVIPVFVWVLTFAIIFALRLIQPVISVLTFIKGTVLLATTVVAFYVGVSLGRTITNDFAHLGAPFLMGTVALGGTINTMPFTFEKIKYRKNQITNYRFAVQLGLWTCVFLNILWCWAVLDIVPQTVAEACMKRSSLLSSNISSTSAETTTAACYGELSLESAKLNGEISTLPMTKILQRDYPSYTWVAVLVELFIMVSITVSYLTIGGALHHTLTGVVTTLARSRGLNPLPPEPMRCDKFNVMAVLTSLLAFIIVFAIAMANPKGFVDILEKLVSFTMNGQAALFTFLMLLSARKMCTVEIPVPIPAWAYHLQWTIPLFFGTAVAMDIYTTARDIISPQHVVPVVGNASLSLHMGVNASGSLHTNGWIPLDQMMDNPVLLNRTSKDFIPLNRNTDQVPWIPLNRSLGSFIPLNHTKDKFVLFNRTRADFIPLNRTLSGFKPFNRTMDQVPWIPWNQTMGNFIPLNRPMGDFVPLNRTKDEFIPLNRTKDSFVPLNRTMGDFVPLNRTKDEFIPLNRTVDSFIPLNRTLSGFRPVNRTVDQVPWIPLNQTMGNFIPLNRTMDGFMPLNRTKDVFIPLNRTADNFIPLNRTLSGFRPVNRTVDQLPWIPLNQTVGNFIPLNRTMGDFIPFNHTKNSFIPLNRTMDNFIPLNRTLKGFTPLTRRIPVGAFTPLKRGMDGFIKVNRTKVFRKSG